MNGLQVKTINLTPAVVEFNYEEISVALDQSLEKYEGLTFTEKESADCKKTITELRKGKKALDAYRKDTKKQLTASVTTFENQCKALSKKFDEVINPLVEQHDQFEDARKESKRKLILDIARDFIEEQGLNTKYADKLLDIPEEYLNKGKTLKSIKEELSIKAHTLGEQQDKDEAHQDLISAHVELVNTKYNLGLSEASYISMLKFDTVDTVKKQIEADALNEVTKAQKQAEETQQEKVTVKHQEEFVEKYEVTGTESQLDALEEFMNQQEIQWEVIKE